MSDRVLSDSADNHMEDFLEEYAFNTVSSDPSTAEWHKRADLKDELWRWMTDPGRGPYVVYVA